MCVCETNLTENIEIEWKKKVKSKLSIPQINNANMRVLVRFTLQFKANIASVSKNYSYACTSAAVYLYS